MKNNQHQILFTISYKTCIFKDIRPSQTEKPINYIVQVIKLVQINPL